MTSSQSHSNPLQHNRRFDMKTGAINSMGGRNFVGPSTRSYQQQPNVNQTPLIPEALGIGTLVSTSSTSDPDIQAQTSAAAVGWTLSTYSSTHSSDYKIGSNQPSYKGESSGSRSAHSPLFRSEDGAILAGRSPDASHNQANGMSNKQADSPVDSTRDSSVERISGALDGIAMLNRHASGNGNGTRNFLVPIGSTGARQKLSILSASQRPATSQSTMAESMQSNDAIVQQYRGQVDAAARRRPATGGEDGRGPLMKAAAIDPTIRNVQHSRSMSLAEEGQSGSSAAPLAMWSAGKPEADRMTVDHLRSFVSNNSSTQSKPYTGPFRSMSQQDLRESIAGHSTSQGESSTQGKSGRSTRMGMSWRQPSRDGSVKATDGEGDGNAVYQQQGERSIVYTRSSDNLRSMRNTRPASSSSNKERAVKIGAGIKSMFGSKSIKEVPSNSADESVHSLYDENHVDDPTTLIGSPSTSKKRQQQQSNTTLPRVEQSPRSLAIDVTEAKNAGWTALPLKQEVKQIPRNGASLSNTSDRLGLEGLDGGNSTSTKPTDLAPLIDFQLPITTGLFDDFTSESLFSFSDISGDKDERVEGVSNGRPINMDRERSPSAAGGWQEQEKSKQTRSVIERQPAKMNTTAPERKLVSMPSASRLGERSLSSLRHTPDLSETPRGTSMEKTLSRTTPSYDRFASLSSVHATDRRESNATMTSSDAHDMGPPSASAISSSSSTESTYSAPNSSRSWTPNNIERTSMPITSPLLASVLGQHVQSGQQQQNTSASNAESVVSPPRRVQSPLAAMDTSSSSITPIVLPLEWERIPDISTNSPADSITTSPRSKPDIPTKSRERQISVRSATGGTTSNAPQQTVNQIISSDDSNETIKITTEEKGVSANIPDKSSYVPPGALTYTRKGTVVKPSITKTSLPLISSVAETSKSNDSNSWSFEGGLLSPQFQSRFSMTSSDPNSSPHESLKMANGYAPKEEEGNTASGHHLPLSSEEYDSYDHEEEDGSFDVVNLLPASAWNEVEMALTRFKSMPIVNGTSNDKGNLLRSILLPFLALEAETIDVQVSGSGPFQSGKSRRALFFDWIQQLLLELQTVQTSADRGAILESIACIIESRNFTATMFQSDLEDSQKFYNVFGHILSYAIGELNKKGVYQNTLIFSGRLLAVAFFRIEGVASKLLRALPVNRFALERVAAEINWNDTIPLDWEAYKRIFPSSLHDFCFQDARSYLKILDSQTISPSKDDIDDQDRYLVRQDHVEVEMSGNWLRRWQSDDSELFFSFCRSYHRQTATLLTTNRNAALSFRHYFFGGPGYAHLATCIHQKCLSLVHRDILSVTTLSSQKNFNPGETANVLSGSTAGKPRHLEAANRRCTAIVVDIIRAPSATTTAQHHIFGPMLGIHIKCLIKRTSLYDVQGVFCLLDWLDGVLNHLESAELPIEKLVDVEFVIQTIWLLLKDADHALALMRTIAFCYSNFAILTSTSKNRIRFCQEILLHPKIFQKLFLSWSFTIRAYFLHLLVFRLARINDFTQPEDDIKGKTSISVAKLFNQRLDEIRKRHDELSPPNSSVDSNSEEEGDLNRFKNRPQSFISTIKHTGTSTIAKTGSPASMRKAERLLGIGQPDPALSNKGESSKAQSRAAKWLRALSSKGTTKNGMNKRFENALLPGVTMWGGSPTIENKNAFENGHTRSQKRLASVTDEVDMEMEKGDEGNEGSDPTALVEDGMDDTTPTHEASGYEFNFEGKPGHQEEEEESRNDQGMVPPPDYQDEEKAANEHISRKLSFDLQSPHSIPPPLSQSQDGTTTLDEENPLNELKLPVPGSHHRVSRAFNRRQSLLPGPAYDLVHHDSTSEEDESGQYSLDSTGLEEDSQNDQLESSNDSSHVADNHNHNGSTMMIKKKKNGKERLQVSEPYRETLHIYAIQSLREYEQTVLEHDEFFAKQVDEENPQVPRLPIQWPAMWSE